MSLVFLLPAGLAALLALVLPLVIHLARRSEAVPTDFAALRWLRQKPKPRHRLRFDEWPLLLTRLALLTLLALFLALPVLLGETDGRTRIAVVPGADLAQVRALADASADRRWLAPGFPSLDDPAPTGSLQFVSLLRQFDAELSPKARLVVFVPALLRGADAELPKLSHAVDWRIVPGIMPATPAARIVTPALTVRYSPGHSANLRYLRAAAKALQVELNTGPSTDDLPVNAQALVWLAPGPLPASIGEWIRRGGTALLGSDTAFARSATTSIYWRDEAGAPLIEGEPSGRGRILHLTRSLTPASMPDLLDPAFPDRLRALFAAPPPAPSEVAARDYAPLGGGRSYLQRPRDLQPWLSLLIAGVFLLERWLATRRRASVP